MSGMAWHSLFNLFKFTPRLPKNRLHIRLSFSTRNETISLVNTPESSLVRLTGSYALAGTGIDLPGGGCLLLEAAVMLAAVTCLAAACDMSPPSSLLATAKFVLGTSLTSMLCRRSIKFEFPATSQFSQTETGRVQYI